MTRRTLFSTLLAATLQARTSRKNWVIGTNTAVSGFSLMQAIELARSLGFEAMEIQPMGVPQATAGQFPGFEFDKLSAGERQALSAALRSFGHVTSHLPYTRLDYFGADQAVADAAIRIVDIALEGSAFFGAKLCVLHPQPGKGFTTLTDQWPSMLRRIRRWGDMARQRNMQIALETGYPMSVADFVRLVQEVDHPAVGATIDVGHQGRYAELVAKVSPEDRATPEGIRAYNDTTLSIIQALGRKVIHLHVHDIDPPTWKEHQPIGTGFVDYPRLFTKLEEVNYQGLLVLEIAGPGEKMRELLPDNKQRLERWLR